MIMDNMKIGNIMVKIYHLNMIYKKLHYLFIFIMVMMMN